MAGILGHNRLADEPSAYLRQHADNPVHWQTFGDAAFAAAVERDVPVFLSIGYAACHWCHVMAGESFEDQETAEYLNANFVPIKVDREERPDVDAVYMAATQAISGEGGWPMSVFLLPDGRAFHAGTYFPPVPVPGRPSFRQVLEAVVEAWRERREAVEHQAAALADSIGEARSSMAVTVSGPEETVDGGILAAAVKSLAAAEDRDAGGFGSAPKFPPSSILEFLIRHAAVPSDTAAMAHGLAGRTLAVMARSALFDQLAGGFARYSVTRDWSVPHFEKMLYDNAQLLRAYAHWIRLGGSGNYPAAEAADVAGMTADWMLAALGMPDALASSLDADALFGDEHHEGAGYLWTRQQLEELLGPQSGGAVAKIMNIGEQGSVSPLGSPLHPARALDYAEQELWDSVRGRMLEDRTGRPQPDRDDKVVAGWNGLATGALADAGAILDRPDLVAAAEAAADYLARVHWRPGAVDGENVAAEYAAGENTAHGILTRVSHHGVARGVGGLLEDYAFCADGLFALYAVTGNVRWYRLAEELVRSAVGHFTVEGKLVDSAGASKQVLHAQGGRRSLDPFDNATPSGVSAFAGALLTSAAYSGSSGHRRLAHRILGLLPPLAAQVPRVAGSMLATAQAALAGPLEAAVVGPDDHLRKVLHRELLRSSKPGLVVAVADTAPAAAGGLQEMDGDPRELPELLHGRKAGTDGRPLAYICRNMVCSLPVDSVEALRRQL